MGEQLPKQKEANQKTPKKADTKAIQDSANQCLTETQDDKLEKCTVIQLGPVGSAEKVQLKFKKLEPITLNFEALSGAGPVVVIQSDYPFILGTDIKSEHQERYKFYYWRFLDPNFERGSSATTFEVVIAPDLTRFTPEQKAKYKAEQNSFWIRIRTEKRKTLLRSETGSY